MKRKREKYKFEILLYFILRICVIYVFFSQIWQGNYENAFLCVLTLGLFALPELIEHKLKLKLPNVLETVILIFIFSAEILGEIQNFYGIFENWDTILHVINGFLCAAIGFSLVNILNDVKSFHLKMSPVFITFVAICFSMTIGILWEFTEYTMDVLFLKDMQKDKIVTQFATKYFDKNKDNKTLKIKNVKSTKIEYLNENGETENILIDGGYLDLGIRDTMKDLMVNFFGAIVYSAIGYLYIKNKDGYKVAKWFLVVKKNERKIVGFQNNKMRKFYEKRR